MSIPELLSLAAIAKVMGVSSMILVRATQEDPAMVSIRADRLAAGDLQRGRLLYDPTPIAIWAARRYTIRKLMSPEGIAWADAIAAEHPFIYQHKPHLKDALITVMKKGSTQ